MQEFYNKRIKTYFKKYKYFLIGGIVILIAIFLPVTKSSFSELSKGSNMEKVCKLATLQATYHNVGGYKQEASNIIKYGYKRYWVEYDAKVDIGIDCNKVKYKKSPFSNVVKVYLPKAEILGEPVPDKDTIVEEYESGWFTSIDSDKEMNYAYTKAKENINETLLKDPKILEYASERAKKIYEDYIVSYNDDLVVEVYYIE